MTWPVRVKSIAEAEFAEGAVWYYRRSVTAAEAFLAAVESTLAKIGESPDMYPIVHRTIHRAVIPSFPYAIYSSRAPLSALSWRFTMASDTHADGQTEVRANMEMEPTSRVAVRT